MLLRKNKVFFIDDAFINLKIKQIIALEDLDATNIESECTQASENVELNWSGWVYNRIHCVGIDLHKVLNKGGGSFVDFFMKCSSIMVEFDVYSAFTRWGSKSMWKGMRNISLIITGMK